MKFKQIILCGNGVLGLMDDGSLWMSSAEKLSMVSPSTGQSTAEWWKVPAPKNDDERDKT